MFDVMAVNPCGTELPELDEAVLGLRELCDDMVDPHSPQLDRPV